MSLRLILAFFLVFEGGPWAFAQTAPEITPPAKAPDEVTLEVNVVQIILNDEHRSGIDWGAIVSDFHTAPLKKENDPMWNDKTFSLSFGTLSEDDYGVLLDALDMAGQVTQLPQPPVKVIADTPAVVNFDKQNIKVGLMLTRQPSGDLTLHMDPSIAVAATETFNGQKAPASVLLEADSNTTVAENTTVVIGGFIKEEEIKRMHKFFLLGDIPIFGLVFRSRGKLMQKTETVIFLTERTNAVETPVENDDLP